MINRLPWPTSAPFPGWWVVVSAGALFAFNTLIFQVGFGAYFVHLQDAFGWSATVLSGSYSLAQVAIGLMGPVQGFLIDRFGARMVARVGVVVFGLGAILFSFTDSIAIFYASFFVIAIGSSLVGWITLNVAVSRWFARKRATAFGLVSVGGSIGGLAIPGLAWSMNTFGWENTAFATGVMVLALGLPVVQFLRSRPEDYGLVPDGVSGTSSSARAAEPVPATVSRDGEDFTLKEALRTRAFWLISLGHSFAVLIVFSVNVHMIAHVVDRLGVTVQTASFMFSLMILFTIVGQVGGGIMTDQLAHRVDKRRIAAVAMLGHVVGLLVLAFATNLVWVALFAALHGLAWGIRGPIMSSMRADYFGTSALGAILGVGAVFLMIGTVGGPLVAGFLADLTEDFRTGFVVLAMVASLAVVFFTLSRRPTRQTRMP